MTDAFLPRMTSRHVAETTDKKRPNWFSAWYQTPFQRSPFTRQKVTFYDVKGDPPQGRRSPFLDDSDIIARYKYYWCTAHSELSSLRELTWNTLFRYGDSYAQDYNQTQPDTPDIVTDWEIVAIQTKTNRRPREKAELFHTKWGLFQILYVTLYKSYNYRSL